MVHQWVDWCGHSAECGHGAVPRVSWECFLYEYWVQVCCVDCCFVLALDSECASRNFSSRYHRELVNVYFWCSEVIAVHFYRPLLVARRELSLAPRKAPELYMDVFYCLMTMSLACAIRVGLCVWNSPVSVSYSPISYSS